MKQWWCDHWQEVVVYGIGGAVIVILVILQLQARSNICAKLDIDFWTCFFAWPSS